ncbi:MAG: hypothetical protein Q4B26_03505 [Eubacteriales bacterium]|nr:hypothetical protein [Eubacteriales bacterium]
MYNIVTENASLEEIKKAFAELNEKMEQLQNEEPSDETGKEYAEWEKECEELAVRSETLMTWIDRKMTAGL